MYKGHFKRAAFIKARVAQSVDHQARNLNVAGSSRTVGKNFVFCINTFFMLYFIAFDALLAGRLVPYKLN